MSFDTAKLAVDMFFKNIKNNSAAYNTSRKAIHFYGGEPLINFKIIKEIIDYVESNYSSELASLGDKFIFSLITNGTLINKDIAIYISSHMRI